jgi:3-hydroxyacyl-CoA dehydrogenase/enoyl-CoA hydratase/3-hydroxybutyryl-CoA epimerase/3-hydroxyacyl-CoA dehydrogenase/enoyl-CoA hydratase/3-hydroxybutyryl-CoA epimerase/enoyl-CoA isomerase
MVQRVGIIGAGLMGRSIALANLERGLSVVLMDVSRPALDRAADLLRQQVSPHHAALLRVTSALADMAGCDLVLEAVVESLKVKRQVFARLEELAADDAIFASNTSCICIDQIAAGLAAPERLCGLHFCHPVQRRPLAEVIGGKATTDAVIATAFAYVRSLAMEVVLVKDTPGFVINRVLYPYLNEGLVLLDEGVGMQEIDTAALAFGMPWGPLTQMDEIGIDVVLRGGQIMAQAYPEYAAPADLLIALFGMGRLGRKTSAGFYRYGAHQSPIVDAEIQGLLRQRARPRPIPQEAIRSRLFGRIAQECRRIVEEGVVAGFDDVERALVKGLGFADQNVLAIRPVRSGGSSSNRPQRII